jgi:uncharacterized protein YodC (DUF2158 family)
MVEGKLLVAGGGVAKMSVVVGDVVRFKDAGPKSEIGRVCRDNGLTVCVQFQISGCLRVGKSDLEVTTGKAPECSQECKEGR